MFKSNIEKFDFNGAFLAGGIHLSVHELRKFFIEEAQEALRLSKDMEYDGKRCYTAIAAYLADLEEKFEFMEKGPFLIKWDDNV